MKEPQDHKKVKIDQQQEDFITMLKAIREEKNLEEIADLFLKVVAIYGLTMSEVAALNYYITEQTVKAKHNATFMKDHLNLDVNELSVDGILQVQRALVAAYVDEQKQ